MVVIARSVYELCGRANPNTVKRVYHIHVYQSGFVFDTEVVLCKIYTDLQGLVSIGFCKSFIKLSPLYVPTFPQEMKFRRGKA